MEIGLLGILGIVFIVLKLCHVIAWSWWLVLLPIYGGLIMLFSIVLVLVFGVSLKILFLKKENKKEEK